MSSASKQSSALRQTAWEQAQLREEAMDKFMAQMNQRIKKLEAENCELQQEMCNLKAERWQLLDDNMEKDIKLQEMEEQGQEYMAHSKEEKERYRAEVELIWVQNEEEFRGAKTHMDKKCMEALQQIGSSISKMEIPKERRLPSFKKGVPQDVIKAEPMKLGPGIIKTDLEKVIAGKEEEKPLKDPTKSPSMGEKRQAGHLQVHRLKTTLRLKNLIKNLTLARAHVNN